MLFIIFSLYYLYYIWFSWAGGAKERIVITIPEENVVFTKTDENDVDGLADGIGGVDHGLNNTSIEAPN